MRKRALMIASIAAGVVLAAGPALAQSSGVGEPGPTSMQGQGPGGTGPSMMQSMARRMGPCMGQGMMQHMMQHMGHGMMRGGMMQGGLDLTQIDPAQVATLKSELGITPAQESAWTRYSNVISDAATTIKSTREAAKTAADELLTALDEGQKTKAREILPGLASSSMMGGITTADHRQQH